MSYMVDLIMSAKSTSHPTAIPSLMARQLNATGSTAGHDDDDDDDDDDDEVHEDAAAADLQYTANVLGDLHVIIMYLESTDHLCIVLRRLRHLSYCDISQISQI